jgi:delta(3,5)-delta(2,4)-dienoyl-CoA isomerase
MFYTFKKGTEQIKETYDTFDVEKTLDKVVHLVLKRDLALNSTDLQYYDDFNHFFNAVNYERDVRCIVLTAKGKHFCAGLDLKETVATLMTFDESIDTARKALLLEEKIKYMQDAFTAIERCRFPVIAGVHGGVIGAGIDLITACDIVYSTKDAFFSVKEVDIGMVADLGTLQRLQIITSNWSLMKEYCLTGERFSPEEAVKLGIVSRVFESQDELHSTSRLI